MKNRLFRNLIALGILAVSITGASVFAHAAAEDKESIAFVSEAYILPAIDAEVEVTELLENGGEEKEIVYSTYDDSVAEVNEEGILVAKEYGVTTIIASLASDEAVCASIDVAVCDFYGMYSGTKTVEAMGCDIAVEITLNEDGTYSFYRAPMLIDMEGGGEMPEMTDKGTYKTEGTELIFTGEELGEFSVTFQIEEEKTFLSGKVPTGGPTTQLELVKQDTEEDKEAESVEAEEKEADEATEKN